MCFEKQTWDSDPAHHLTPRGEETLAAGVAATHTNLLGENGETQKQFLLPFPPKFERGKNKPRQKAGSIIKY